MQILREAHNTTGLCCKDLKHHVIQQQSQQNAATAGDWRVLLLQRHDQRPALSHHLKIHSRPQQVHFSYCKTLS